MAKKKAAKKAALAAPALNNPPRPVVKPDVISCIYAEAILNRAHIHKPNEVVRLVTGDETLVLESDLLIGGARRAALSQCYDQISHGKHKGERVSPAQSRVALTVANAISLVHKAANQKTSATNPASVIP